MTKIIGLTGGIGSGKTTVAKRFESLGVPIYIADDEAKIITNSTEILNQIRVLFGSSVFDGDVLNRKILGQIVFSDNKKLKQLNNIIHPAVRIHFSNWLKDYSKSDFVIYESAVLFENNGFKNCDLIISVLAPIETRIERVIQRDKMNREEILLRMKNQYTDKQRIEKSDFTINNDILENTFEQVDSLFLKLKHINPNKFTG